MGQHYRRAAILALIAAVLLANPFYIGFFVDEEQQRQSQGYSAMEVDPSNSTDQKTIIRQYGGEEVIVDDELRDMNEYRHLKGTYRSPDEAAQALLDARANGQTPVTNPDVQRTLERLEARHSYAKLGEGGEYYRFDIVETEEGVRLTVTETDTDGVVEYLVDSKTTLYDSYNEHEKEEIEKVLSNEGYDYRPLEHENIGEYTDEIIYKDGTHYVIRNTVVTDDFGPMPRQLASFFLTVAGILTFLGALVSFVLTTRSRE